MHDLDTLTELSLFSGACAFTLGLRLAGVRARTVCYVENEPCGSSSGGKVSQGGLTVIGPDLTHDEPDEPSKKYKYESYGGDSEKGVVSETEAR